MSNFFTSRYFSHCLCAKHRQIFRGHLLAFASVMLLSIYPTVPLSAGETVEFSGTLLPGGGQYLNLWHNGTPGSFSYWGNSLVPTGNYQTYDWNGPTHVNYSYSLDGNTIILHSGAVRGSIFGAINDTLTSAPHDVTNNRIIVYSGTVGEPPTVANNLVERTSGNVFGGWTSIGNALNNRVEIYDGTALGLVCGGLSSTDNTIGSAIGNSVLISGAGVKIGGTSIPVTEVEALVNDWVNSVPLSEPFESMMEGLAARLGLSRLPTDEVALAEALMQELGTRNTDGTISIGGDVRGGSSGGDALNNTVTMTSGSVGENVYGGYSSSGSALENTVSISGGNVGRAVYGGWSRGSNAISYNRVFISGDAVIGTRSSSTYSGVYGGWTDTWGGVIDSNEVTISGNVQVLQASAKHSGVYGGWAEYSGTTITNNKVTLSNDVWVETEVAGGYVGGSSNSIQDNQVTLSGNVSIGADVYGGYVKSSPSDVYYNSIQDNQVALGGSVSVGGGVYGGYVNGFTNIIQNNQVTLSGDVTVAADVAGGYVGGYNDCSSNTLQDNQVTLSGNASVGGNVYGGYVDGYFNTIQNNQVTLNGNVSVAADVAGGYTTDVGDVLSNSVTINGGSVGGIVYGGYVTTLYDGDELNALNNTVTVNGGALGNNVYGSYVASDKSGIHSALSNAVAINGGTINGDVYAGYAGGANGLATAFTNAININGGTVTGNVYGGYAVNDSGIAIAENNIVNLNGGTVIGNVYAGYAKGLAGNVMAEGNEMNIIGNPNLAGAVLYGGWTSDDTHNFDSNILNVHSSGVRVAGLNNFKNLHFYIPNTLPVGGTMLIVDGDITNVGDTFVSLDLTGSRPALQGGDYFVLIDGNKDTMEGTPENDTWATGSTARVRQGVTLLYEFDIVANTNDGITGTGEELWAILPRRGGGGGDGEDGGGGDGPTVDPCTESLSKGFLTGMSLLNQSHDLIAGRGMSGAIAAAQQARHGQWGAFFDMSGGKSRYDTGCYVDLSSMSLIAGVSKCKSTKIGHWTLGAFFEYGDGSYDTCQTFIEEESIYGNGHVKHLGGGLLGRLEFPRSSTGHFYTEAGFRAGELSNGYFSADICDGQGRAARYDASSAYYGANVGVGKLWSLSNRSTFDLYTRYLWSDLQKASVILSTDDPVDFRSVNSHRLRVGGRLTGSTEKRFKPYIGAAWEHEFSGTACGSTYGYAFEVPSLRGDTGMGELGIAWRSGLGSGLFIDFGVQGYGGKREGVAANLTAGWKF